MRVLAFNNLQPVHAQIAGELRAAVQRVLDSGWFVLGPEVESFEEKFAAYHGGGYVVGVANGTDALELALRGAGIGPGEEVITVAHTAVATICAIERAGAVPVFVDIDPRTYTIDVDAAAAAITPRTRAIVAVHLYGHPADMSRLQKLARRQGLMLIEDCAQAHGARHEGQLVGTMGDVAAFSFYPTKNLGALGDGGAVLTRHAALAERVRGLRNYGQVRRYEHRERGMNSRLDELQAAVLGVKLAYLDEHNARRRHLAERYRTGLLGRGVPVTLPREESSSHHVFHLYVVRHPRRDRLREHLDRCGIGTLVHYPIPVHLQHAYRDLGYRPGSLPHTEQAAREVVSLPMYIGLTEAQVEQVVEAMAAPRWEAA
jgi:dTDP-4-amino-4,6-dideoxygalactose transaminase